METTGDSGGWPSLQDALSDKQGNRWTFGAHRQASQTGTGPLGGRRPGGPGGPGGGGAGEAAVLHPAPMTNCS